MKAVIFISIFLSLVFGFLLSYLLWNKLLEKKRKKIIEEANQKAEVIIKEKELEAKENFLRFKEEQEKQLNEKSLKLKELETTLIKKETLLNQKIEEVNKLKIEADKTINYYNQQLELVKQKEIELEKILNEQIEKLQKISNMSAEEAKQQLLENYKAEVKMQAAQMASEILEETKLTVNKEAKKIIVQAIQRLAVETTAETTITVFPLENEEMKGRIIGREGRNIKAFESLTGVELIVDDTPEAIVLSSFDPVRRQIAYIALQQLVADGRIHPTRIEEVVEKAKEQVEEDILETGKRTCIDLGIQGLHIELVKLVGKMKYRTSYGQNLLQHSKEVANLCAIMAAELGINPKLAKRAGLLHDIGKVSNDNPELSHALLGMHLAEKYKERPEVCNAIGAHHEEIPMTSFLAPIVQICDAISGARPGARREVTEAYIKRVKDLEQIALSFPGVVKAYAIQAGRELRAIVSSDILDDKQILLLANEIARKIQEEMTYPGQIKVVVVRETRAIAFAK